MALTASLPGNTPHSVCFVLIQDGAAGTTLTLTNADLIAAAPAGTPVGDMLRRAVASSAEAQRIMQSIQIQMPPNTDRLVGRCTIQSLSAGGGLVPGNVAVSANEAAGLIQLLLASTAAANQWLLYIDVLHSLTR